MTAADDLAAEVQNGLERALASLQSARPADAFATLEVVLHLDPHNFDALNLSGVAATRLQRHDEAIHLLERALAVRPDHAGACNNMGLALRGLGRNEAALDAYLRTVELAPGFAPGHANLGATYAALNNHKQAVDSLNRSLRLRPDHVDTLIQLGGALRRSGRPGEALATLDRALGLAPTNVDALIARGDCLRDLQRHQEALVAQSRALELAPDREFLLGSVLHRELTICDWTHFSAHRDELARRIAAGERAIHPFTSLLAFDDPGLQLTVAKTRAGRSPSALSLPALRRAAGKIHVGYFSADYHRHPMMYLMCELLALHDRDRFRVSAFAFNVRPEDEYTERVRRSVDDYVLLDAFSDAEAAAVARDRHLDIAVDILGYTTNNRAGIFGHRAAPVQVNYLAYPGTTGAPYIDYIIADHAIVPDDAVDGYSEKIAWMPDCYAPRDTTVSRPTSRPRREEHGLPSDAVVFCSFNQSGKILPDTFADWMRILDAVAGSVLWLYASNPVACDNLRKEAAARGVDPARLIFATSLPLSGHLERLQLADLCLDTLPYNAHTTANDSLYVGVPILTLPGRSFAGRVCASLLTTLGLPELIATDREDYVRIAIELGTDRQLLSAIGRRLAAAGEQSPLYDMPRYVQAVERGYELMVDRHSRGLPPDHIAIRLD